MGSISSWRQARREAALRQRGYMPEAEVTIPQVGMHHVVRTEGYQQHERSLCQIVKDGRVIESTETYKGNYASIELTRDNGDRFKWSNFGTDRYGGTYELTVSRADGTSATARQENGKITAGSGDLFKEYEALRNTTRDVWRSLPEIRISQPTPDSPKAARTLGWVLVSRSGARAG